MDEKIFTNFQTAVDSYLIRHRSVVDIMTKYQESAARVNRAFAKAVTECGCIKISADRQNVPVNTDYSNIKQFMSTHLKGEPCDQCKEILAKELGHNIFYFAALCNVFNLNLNDVIQKEYENVTMLGPFHLS